MSKIKIQKIGITHLNTDAIVNAANEHLQAGGGVCGAIFSAAGMSKLQAACDKIGHCNTGSAVITPGFGLKAKFIIHAVGPRYSDGKHNEPQLLYSAYESSLKLAMDNGCRSIGFPLISAGIFGYPLKGAWDIAISACLDFIKIYPSYNIEITFAVLDDHILTVGNNTLERLDTDNRPAEKSDLDTFNMNKKAHAIIDNLNIEGREVPAVFFHRLEEPNGYLSNWYRSPFMLDGISFTSAEQYIMYRKCIIFGDTASANLILKTDDPAKQQDIGRKTEKYIDNVWKGMRQAVAISGLLAKFTQNEDLKKQLLDTGDAVLVECAHHDKDWACGIGLDNDDRFCADKWRGQNILGFALMEVRSIIRNGS